MITASTGLKQDKGRPQDIIDRRIRAHDEADDRIYRPKHSVTDYLPMQRLMDRYRTSELGSAFWRSQAYHERHYPASPSFLKYKAVFEDIGFRMLNAKELAKVLNANTHPRLFSSWLIMSPNATLLAYSGKPDIQRLRDQAALLSQIWHEEKTKLKNRGRDIATTDQYSSSASTTVSTVSEGALETLTIENAFSNIIIRAVQPRLLLVLFGGSPPRRKSDFFKVTAEAKGEPRYPPEVSTPAPEHEEIPIDESAIDEPDPNGRQPPEYHSMSDKEKMRLLDIQRKKIDAATEFVRGDLASKDFIMPDEGSIP